MDKLPGCKNAMNGFHVKAEKVRKNKNKPDTCKFCTRLWVDIEAHYNQGIGANSE